MEVRENKEVLGFKNSKLLESIDRADRVIDRVDDFKFYVHSGQKLIDLMF